METTSLETVQGDQLTKLSQRGFFGRMDSLKGIYEERLTDMSNGRLLVKILIYNFTNEAKSYLEQNLFILFELSRFTS